MRRYISDSLKEKICHSPPGSIWLLKAPTGSGKTTFTIRELTQEARQRRKRVLLVVNRNILTEQLVSIILSEMGISPNDIEWGCDGYYPLGDIVVCSYQYLARRIQDKHRPDFNIGPFPISAYAFVVCDECHYFFADAVFSTDYDSLKNMAYIFHQATRIYASATIEPVRDFILERIEKIEDLEPNHAGASNTPYAFRYAQNDFLSRILSPDAPIPANCFEAIGADVDYSYMHPRILADGTKLWNDIINQCKSHRLHKAVVFVNSKEQGKKCKEVLNNHDIPAAFLISRSSDSGVYVMDSLDEKVLDEIKTKNRFDSVSVLIATAVLDNGTNLIDSAITHLYISGTEYVSAVQQAGRVRIYEENQNLELVIPRKNEKYFLRNIVQWEKQRDFLKKWLNADAKTKEDMFFNGELEFLKARFSYTVENRPKESIFTFSALEYYISDAFDTLSKLKEDPDGYVKKALGWFQLTYDVSFDESYISQSNSANEFQAFLAENTSKPLSKEEWTAFRQTLRSLYEASTKNTLCSGKKDRIPGLSVVQDILKPYGYCIITKGKFKYLTKMENL